METIRGTAQEVRIESVSITISDSARNGKSVSIRLDEIVAVRANGNNVEIESNSGFHPPVLPLSFHPTQTHLMPAAKYTQLLLWQRKSELMGMFCGLARHTDLTERVSAWMKSKAHRQTTEYSKFKASSPITQYISAERTRPMPNERRT